MSDKMPPLLVALMWNLMFTGEEPSVSKAKPGVKKKTIAPLLDAGLIVLDKRGNGNHLVLTDRAWKWAEENLDGEFSTRANTTPALLGLLPKLKAYLQQTGTPLAELLNAVEPAAPQPPAEPDAPAQAPIDEAIRKAYRTLSGGQWETRVRLAQLREHLDAYAREEQDRALLRMQSEGRLVLYRLDDPQDTFEADRAAALYLGSDPRHLIYMKG